jgi:hypothetical protein
MNPDAVVQSHVDARAGLVNVASAVGDEPYGEFTQLALVEFGQLPGFEPAAAIEPDLITAVQEDIRDLRIGYQAPQRPEFAESFP